MEIGVYLRGAQDYDEMLDLAKRADDLGYFGGFINDHIHGFADEGKEPYLEAWTTMTGIGVQTQNLRIGQIVLFNSLRNPAYLAKSVATLDNMTKGRYEFLIGAGWNEPEYIGYDLMEGGRGMPSAKERVDRFEESIKIFNLMLNQETTDFDGKFWKLDNAINNPQPVQKPMRISVGCKGPRMMKITAKYATGINLSYRTLPTIQKGIDEFSEIVNENTDKSVSDYYISGFSSIIVNDNPNSLREQTNEMIKRMNIDQAVEEFLNERLVGSTDEIKSKLQEIEVMGMEMIVASIRVEGNDDPLGHFKYEILDKM